MSKPKYPGIRVVANGNELVAYHTEARIAEAGVFYPITPSTEMGELFQLSFAEGRLNVFGKSTVAIETEGEHAAQGGAIAFSVTGKRVVNFTSGQGIVYGVEQYYHAPGKLATMVLEVAARALTKHALNVHCGHDDIYAALDTGWIMLMAKDAQQAADQALILRKVTECSLTPGMNIQDGFLTSHLERSFYKHEAQLIRDFLGDSEDIIDCPTPAQRELFGPTRRRVPEVIDLKNPALIGPVQNQEHYMNGVIARRNNFYEPILGFLQDAYHDFGSLTGRHYGLLTEYKTDGADTVFVSLGSAAENIEAAVDYMETKRDLKVGSIHVNVIRPFPEAAIAKALAGRKNVIVLERTDEALSADNPLAKDVRVALGKALERHKAGLASTNDEPAISEADMPRILRGTYGLGSRDFRPEAILGAVEYALGEITRKDGRRAKDGETYFTLGIDHPYAVVSKDTPSLLPDHAIAVRLHSIGGWGMITTGKNLGAIIGDFNKELEKKAGQVDDLGRPVEVLHVSANPKYGSEKKGAPTAYFLVVAPQRIRVNCDLRHVNVVLCCDPKAFTHSNPLDGLADGGAFVWESSETPEAAWTRIPRRLRQHIIDKKIRIFILPGFDIARRATDRSELQLRMQGNAFLGAFFGVSPFLSDNGVDKNKFHEVVRAQYVKKFSRFGDAVVESNMQVMTEGFDLIKSVEPGAVDAPDLSSMRLPALMPLEETLADKPARGRMPMPEGQAPRAPWSRMSYFDKEFRAKLGYHQPASPLAAVGVMASSTGATASKYVARRETPVFIAENCTQCMACIAACPDTALPNTAQDVSTVLHTAVSHYVSDEGQRTVLYEALPGIEEKARTVMQAASKAKENRPFKDIIASLLDGESNISDEAKKQLRAILEIAPLAYGKANAIFGVPERKNAGQGGLFSIFVSDLCKGCAECVTECGDHDALRMQPDSEALNAQVAASTAFLNLLPTTPGKHLGLYKNGHPTSAKQGVLRNHLMVLDNYQALASGDGACAGCGEKSVLRAVASLTEAYMRPLYHAKAVRLGEKADQLAARGTRQLSVLAIENPEAHALFKQAVGHTIMGLGGEDDADTRGRMTNGKSLGDDEVIEAMVAVLRQDAFNHQKLQPVEGFLQNGMSVMAMGASTGCNTVYGSTPPNNPHPYPWMNSLFQDGATITWMFGESFIQNHARRSVVPERLTDTLLASATSGITPEDYFRYTHFTDADMTPLEIRELPKAWCVGGDGAIGDIGYQNTSKVVLQNRPNVNILLLDTQVYSNTGGQNSDSSPLTGGYDMNQLGAATQGKLTEKKSVAETFTAGHGSPFVAQISMADATKLYKAILDGLDYRGTAFFQAFTTCQPEHGVGDDMASVQAKRIRDSRGMPEFVFNPQSGETYQEAMHLKGNPQVDRDWAEMKTQVTKEKYRYTVAHWAATEARFRRHLKKIKPEDAKKMMLLDDMLSCLTQHDVTERRFQHTGDRAYVPDFGVYIEVDGPKGTTPMALSRQMVLFCVERRKSWRMLQSKAGIDNKDYRAQRALLAKVEKGDVSVADLRKHGHELVDAERNTL